MKLPFTIYDLRFAIWRKSCRPVNPLMAGDARGVTRAAAVNPQSSIVNHRFRRGFTMVEIAISLAIIGIALVAIIGVLPLGLKIQGANREQTVINQDATVFLEAIRTGAGGLDDLTNYVYAITNYWSVYGSGGVLQQSHVSGYSFTGSSLDGGAMTPSFPINSGRRIVGLLSTPEFTQGPNGPFIPALYYGGVSNHVVAYIHSVNGPAVEKPPQANDSIIRQDSFSYRLFVANAPAAMDPSILLTYNVWQSQSYPAGAVVLDNWLLWQAAASTQSTDVPGRSPIWVKVGDFSLGFASALHELRLTFLWPQQPNGSVGPGKATFRTAVAGQLTTIADTSVTNVNLYFYQPQVFANAP